MCDCLTQSTCAMPLIEPLTIRIRVGDENLPLEFKRLAAVLPKLGNVVLKDARKILKQQDKVVSGDLYNSLRYTVNTGKEQMQLTFDAGVPYWDFVNQGVRGAKSSAKAPNSPYQFGTGSYTGTQTLRGGIDRWVIRKPVAGVRDPKTGRFIPRKQLVRWISNIVWNTGIAPSNYYTLAIDQGWKRYKKRMAVAIGLDVNDFVSKNLSGEFTIDITI